MNIVAHDIGKSVGNPSTRILNHISMNIGSGEFVSLTGRSGSGKSTLLYILGSLDSPTEGYVQIDGCNIASMTMKELSQFRNSSMGFVFQFHYLISELTALENVLIPARKVGEELKRKDYAVNLLDKVGLGQKLNRLPRQLSGGEQQRVAIARSLVMEPKYVFADEPTGALDSVNGDIVMKMLMEANAEKRTTIVLVTHDPDFAAKAQRTLYLVDGQLAKAGG